MADAPNSVTTAAPSTVEQAAEKDAASLGQQTTTTTTTAHEAEGGLPQFQFQHWAGQIGYLVILFAILYVLMSRVFAPRIRKIFDAREAAIGGAIASARQVQEEAAAQAEASRQSLAEARGKAQKTAADAKAKAEAKAHERQAAEEAKLNERLAAAEAEIRAARDQAMGNVSAIAVETAQAIVEKLTGETVTKAAVKAAAKQG
jgi:F-type H+-transporting ATPase subunit b